MLILLIFCTSTNRVLIYRANIARLQVIVWIIFYTNFSLFSTSNSCSEGGIVKRETIIQTGDKGSSPSVGKHPSYWSVWEQKCRITASRYLTRSSDLPLRGQTEYKHNDQWKIQLLFNSSYRSQLSSFAILNLCLLPLCSEVFFFLSLWVLF